MRPEAGSSVVLMAGLIGVIATVSVAAAGLGLAYSARTQAQSASDAAALAAAVGTYPPAAGGSAPGERARRIAGSNGATLVSCWCRVDTSLRPRVVTVVTAVSVDVPVFGHLRIRAGSRAEFDPRSWLGR